MTQTLPKGATRVGWVDVAKGAAITLVVLHHSILFLEAVGFPMGPITQANNVLVTIRMPLFFLASGLFAWSPVSGTWRGLWSRKISLLLWVYVVWSVIRFLFFSVVPWPLPENDAGTWSRLASIFVLPSGGLWFVYALAIFFVIARATRTISPWILLSVSGVLSALVGAGLLTTGVYEWDNMGMYLVFFLAGCHLRSSIVDLVGRFTLPRCATIVVVFVVASVVSYVWDLQDVPGVRLAVSVIGVTGALVVARYVSGSRAGELLKYLGRNTLPIYLVHYLFIAAVATALPEFGGGSIVISGVLTLSVTACAIAVSLAVYRVTKGVPGLYDAPAWLSGR